MVLPSIYYLLALDVVFTVSAQVLLRIGAHRLGGSGLSASLIFEPLKNIYLFLGLFLYAVSFFLYIVVLSKIQLSVAYSVGVGTGLILITIISYFFFKETLTALQITGIGVILVGIIFVLLPR